VRPYAIARTIIGPQAELTELPDRGHFLQEEAPGEVGELLARFFAP